MRLIDADALLKEKDEIYIPPEDPEETWCFGANIEVIHLDDVMNAPTIEAEPVRHGRLKYRHVNSHHIPSSCKVICMECGYEKSRLDGEIIRYCQYCGAKMDLKGD
jgi:hypothetical protein